MIIASIDFTYLDTWVWRDQEEEDEVEDGGEDAEDPAELPTVTKEEPNTSRWLLPIFTSSTLLPLHWSRPSIFSILGM